ncbi:hypothetical protein LZ518_08965 [Sphingomonas sp. RB56-2]|uniref:Uncharacterized protein n=1 Tax=Sphingomonas brevis TaxID=2908206 RepID=A0ABT0SA44_9SPHN|nr:hypothetical protein [Sphingomonas brevis]MCL6741258.1 hypothetical protein [Sphingomonas brevis]
MNLRLGLIAAFTVTTLAYPIAAMAQQSDPITVTARDDAAEDQVIVCKYEMKTGSRFKEKTCKTKLQWEQMRIQHQKDAEEMFNRPTIETRRGG